MFNDIVLEVSGLIGSVQIKDFIDIGLVTLILYHLIKFIRDSRALQLLSGIVVLIVVYIFADILQFNAISFILANVVQVGAIALLIIFQPEIRRALESMGRTRVHTFFSVTSATTKEESIQRVKQGIQEVCEACEILSKDKTGALMVFEKESMLSEITITGTKIDALISSSLINNIFFHNSPLHDGAVIIRDGRIVAAGCFLPLSENYQISKQYGTRHRAALGMSESSDALVVVVSEETGKVTLAKGNHLERGIPLDKLKSILVKELITDQIEEKQQISILKYVKSISKGR